MQTAPDASNGWGGARPGAGRKPRAPVMGQRVTLGQAIESLRQAAAPPATPPPGSAGAALPADQAPPPTGVTGPVVREENRSFARLVGYVGTNVGVLVIGDTIRKGGREPNQPDPDDLDRTTDATAEAIAIALGDTAVPWWGALVAAWGNLYLTMRIGARPLALGAAPDQHQPAPAAQPSPAPAPPATVLGQGVPVQRPPESPAPAAGVPWRPLPEVGAIE